MCDRSNAEDIVQEMLTYLETADYTIREEMVLKIAILSEKYAVDYKWYLDVMLKLIRIAGDFVSEEVNRSIDLKIRKAKMYFIGRFGIELYKLLSIEQMYKVMQQKSLSKHYKLLLAMKIWLK